MIHLKRMYPSPGAGTLTMTFTPAGAGKAISL